MVQRFGVRKQRWFIWFRSAHSSPIRVWHYRCRTTSWISCRPCGRPELHSARFLPRLRRRSFDNRRSLLLHIREEPTCMMSEPLRSKRRIAVGALAIIMGCVSLVGLSSTSYYFGIDVFGGAYGAVMIALGVALIAKKEAVT